MDLHKIIQDTLNEFIQACIPNADLSFLDDVLLSYITGVLENLGSRDSMEENFDVDDFVEMLEAYIPGFAGIEGVKVCEMIFHLASKLARARGEDNGLPKMAIKESYLNESTVSPRGISMQETQGLLSMEEGATAKENSIGGDAQMQQLLEMFPKCSVTEAMGALSIAKGDMEEAVRLIIEGDVQLRHEHPLKVKHCKAVSPQADKKLKASILEKYMLVDDEEDKKIHRPVTPKEAPKKLVRYHGGQVVTTKGEKYHQVKNEQTEEMKKTYISLKPARKYRFH
ncbi:CUE domain-containing protein 2 [Brienomyrus brachyistius]|uniref:CUE domain-containing protein 2 n=1 Tax=Brienomyrus brachyistius TaxID=42636 RepID=UPI0020B33F86|nr:CUE domain-containing protein 2 [Brienomyrus brachyistius]XP_048865300.1 CUE domain-containing protein 2 [Brienomyrus brachyistius]